MSLTTNTQSNSMGIYNRASGVVVTDAAAAAIAILQLGFLPRYVKFVNATDRITDEWFEGMASASSIHTVAAGTITLETTNGIAVGSGNTITLTAVTMVASKSYYWVAEG